MAEQPCQVPCGHTGCSVSAFVREVGGGKRVIEYFLVGPTHACADQIRALSFATNNTVEYNRKCIAKIDAMHCGHIAPYEGSGHQFADLSSDYRSEHANSDESSALSESLSSDATLLSSSDSDGIRCLMKEDWCTKKRQSRFLVTFRSGFRGVVIEVPEDFVIEVEPVHLLYSDGSTYRCGRACVLELPVPKCGNSRCDGVSSSGDPDICAQFALHNHHNGGGSPKPVVFVPPLGGNGHEPQPQQLALAGANVQEPAARCAPPSEQLARRAPDNEDGGEARAWLNALEEQAFALAHCSRAPAPDSHDEFEFVLGTAPSSIGNCDMQRCRAALLHSSRLTGGSVPRTAAAFVARARVLATSARESYAAERYNEARQAACCAEVLFETLLAHYECPVEHCNVLHVYPSNAVFAAGGSRRRSQRVDARTKPEHQPGLTVVAFEECDAAAEDFVPDNDINDAVFVAYATSMVGSLTKRWFASALHVETRAIGTTSDFALELRFADAHIPTGSRVRVLHHGVSGGAAEECWVVNSQTAATQECPSTDLIRLVRSVRAALPHHESSTAPFVNTLATIALAEPAHIVSVYIEVPSAAVQPHATPALHLALALRDRSTDCVVRTAHFDSAHSPHGFGVLAPAPFYWPLEGMPAFINSTELPTGGLCVSGDRARARCDEADECAGGYCELTHGHVGSHHCYDAPLPGLNEAALCARPSQCPYGKCYAREGMRDVETGAYPLLAVHLDSPGESSARWFVRRSGTLDEQTFYDVDAHRVRNK